MQDWVEELRRLGGYVNESVGAMQRYEERRERQREERERERS